MCVCIGRKHGWVKIASSALDAVEGTKLLVDTNMKDGYKFPCCQLTVPTVY